MSTKLERKQEEVLGFIRNRLPGRKRIADLHRIALELEIEADRYPGLEKDGELLRKVAELLDEIRWKLRGPNRNDVITLTPEEVARRGQPFV